MLLSCKEIRLRLPLEQETPDTEMEEHLQGCSDCRQLAGWHQRLDVLLRSELTLTAPADLTARLLAVVPAVTNGVPIRTRRWYRQRMIAALIASVLVSISVILLALGLNWFAQAIGADQIIATVTGWPGLLIAHLYEWLPQSQYVIEAVLRLREPLQWLIVALLLWRAFERFRPPHELGSASV